jgi:hypothetical protein
MEYLITPDGRTHATKAFFLPTDNGLFTSGVARFKVLEEVGDVPVHYSVQSSLDGVCWFENSMQDAVEGESHAITFMAGNPYVRVRCDREDTTAWQRRKLSDEKWKDIDTFEEEVQRRVNEAQSSGVYVKISEPAYGPCS